MKHQNIDPEAMLDQAVAGIKNTEPDAAEIEGARLRAWGSIVAAAKQEGAAQAESLGRPGQLTTCADFQALFPEYREGSLPESRRLLVEDHTHECVACRKVLHAQAPATSNVVPMPVRKPAPAWRRYAIAAALIVTSGLAGWNAYDRFGAGPSGSRATVQATRGNVYRVSGATLQLVTPGTEIGENDSIRTGPASHAMLRLRDGSMLEVNERAEFRVTMSRRDTTVNLDRGVVIVQAAKRRTGHLYVVSVDSRVAVTGTIFSVNRGIKGSRVSVVEGEVHVESQGNKSVLHAGDQVATHASVGSVPIQDEIAWSDNFDHHIALLRELLALKTKLEAVRLPGLRYNSRLLDLVPADTRVLLSAPNLGNALGEANRLFNEQLQMSPALRDWAQRGDVTGQQGIQNLVEAVRRVSDYLGEEIVFSLSGASGATEYTPLAVAEVHRPGLGQLLSTELNKLFPGSTVVLVPETGPIPSGTSKDHMLVAVRNNKLIIANDSRAIESVLARAAVAPGAASFAATEFGRRIQSAYGQGAGILVGIDVSSLVMSQTNPTERQMLSRMGIDQTRHVIIEQRQVGTDTQHSAEIGFAGARTGVASWLAAPASIGGLSFVSPDAQLAFSAVFKKPELMLQEFLGFEPGLKRDLEEAQAKLGIDLKNELAANLGGEFTFAFDGPMLPLSWKLILETPNPQGLQAALQKVVNSFNSLDGNSSGCKLDSEARSDAPGGTFYAVRCTVSTLVPEVHYVFVDGYVVMAASRPLLIKAAQSRQSGITLERSDRFTALLPRDGNTHFSTMLYHNAGEFLNRLSAALSPEQQQAASSVAGKLKPMVVCAYSEQDRIRVSSKSNTWDVALALIVNSMNPSADRKVARTIPELKAYR